MNKAEDGAIMAFQSVLKSGNLQAMHLLMEQGVELETCGVQFPLHLAACNHHQQILEYLLDRRLYDVDVFDNHGVTPLHLTARYRCCISASQLIKAGANVNAICNEIIIKNQEKR
ncbi:hypothetical protein QAD02_006426 [Eretmocerus hayati]|uniref:Uncharacterized protein n=1 Tax=Eretmocerus hayati TaxID=131215 RepID=A0ACC2N0V8_9HYME|nr:hypothetical protein QAD02_006426 [Eretmocerus hayati]